MHFTRMGGFERRRTSRSSCAATGCHLEDSNGKRYFDALAGLFSVNIGYSFGEEIGQAALEQMRELPFYTNWSYAHPRAIELAAEVASLAPGRSQSRLLLLRRIRGGRVGVEARAAVLPRARGEADPRPRDTRGARGAQEPEIAPRRDRRRGAPRAARYKAIARHIAYHGTTMGALSINGIPAIRTPFEPLVSEVRHVSNTNRYHRPVGGDRGGVHRASSSTSSSRRSSRWGPRPSASCTWSRCRTRAAASRRPAATGRACARSAIATTSCSRPTRSSPPSAASATGSARSATTSGRTSSRCAKGLSSSYAAIGGSRRDRQGHGAVPGRDLDVLARDHVRRPSGHDARSRSRTSRS